VIIAQGGRFAGWSLYVKDGVPKYVHNWFDAAFYYVAGDEKLPCGMVNIRYYFNFEGQPPGEGGMGRLYVNDKQMAEGKIERTVPFIFSADETMDVGSDLALPVTDDYPEGAGNQFSAKLDWVRIDLEQDPVSHLDPEELEYHRVMARQ